jgi:hypothetical protein
MSANQRCAGVALQSYICTHVPSAVQALRTSIHLFVPVARMLPSPRCCHCWLPRPLQSWMTNCRGRSGGATTDTQSIKSRDGPEFRWQAETRLTP